MVTQFRGRKPIEYSFHIADYASRDSFMVCENPNRKFAMVELRSIENLQEVVEAVQKYMETHYFTEEMLFVDLEEIWNN